MYMLLIEVLVIVLLAVLLKLKKYDDLKKIPGPTWLESIKVFHFSNEDIYRYMMTLPKRYGSVVKIWLKPLEPTLYVADPKYFQQILTSKEHVQKTMSYTLLHDLAGNGLTTNLDTEHWKSDRKLLNNVFSYKDVSTHCPKLKYHTDNLRRVLEQNENKPVDVHFLINQCTLNIMIEYLTQETMDELVATKLITALDKFLEMYMERAYSIYKRDDTIFRFTRRYKTWVENCTIIHETIDNILQRQVQSRCTPKIADKKNFMDLILDNGFSQHSIISHLKTFILAGFSTTGNTISFALYEIAKRPDVQENILQEYFSIIGTDDDVITIADLQSMTYTEAVIKEAMRLYPAVPIIQRRIESPVIIDDTIIPAGVDVIFSIPSLHDRNFLYPTEFDPDRFFSKNLQIDPYGYAPFSLGPRDCIGKRIAMMEMKFIISYIVRNFTLHPVDSEHKLDMVGDFVLQSRNGIPIIFKRRN